MRKTPPPRRPRVLLACVLGRMLGLVASAALVGSCGEGAERSALGPRGAQIASTLAAADEAFVRARPALAAGKFARMAADPVSYLRGSVAVYRADARNGTRPVAQSRFGLSAPLVPSLGDPHPENFGTLRATDGTFALEPNDFDSSDHAPYLWDVRRLVTGLVIAARLANADDESARAATSSAARDVARAAAVAYRDGVARASRGELLPRVTAPEASVVFADLLRRAQRDADRREELDTLSVVEGGRRRLLRGVPDPEDTQNILLDLPAFARAALPQALERYRASRVTPIASEELVVLDAARELGSGVASWPRVRALVLVRGPSDAPEDDVLLEVKELTDSAIAVAVPPFVHANDVGARVLAASRAAWARPDAEPWWGVTTWLGFPCQVRLESEGQKSVRIARLVGRLGTAAALTELGKVLGTLVARVHTTDRRAPERGLERAAAIAARLAVDPEGFADEQADAGVDYAATTLADHREFVTALRALGPTLGLSPSPEDAPRPDLARLYGTPPPPLPLPELP